MILITADEVEERVDTVGNSAKDEEETDPRVQVGEIVKAFLLNPLGAMCIRICTRAPTAPHDVHIYICTQYKQVHRTELPSYTRLWGKSLPIE